MCERWALLDPDAVSANLRLLELLDDTEPQRRLAAAQRILAVNPLLPAAQHACATSAAQLGDDPAVLAAWRALAALDPLDPAEVHFQLAQAHHRLGETDQARREVIKALEIAPRYRAALELLLALVEKPMAEAILSEKVSSEVGASKKTTSSIDDTDDIRATDGDATEPASERRR